VPVEEEEEEEEAKEEEERCLIPYNITNVI